MRLSESIQKKIMESGVGFILNKFKVKKRRDNFFFEELLADYFKLCEKKGFAKETQKISSKWIALCKSTLTPKFIESVPPITSLNYILSPMWENIGMVSDLKASQSGSTIKIETKGETITRLVGPNKVMVGIHLGNLNALYGKKLVPKKVNQNKKQATYEFEITDKDFSIKSKKKEDYNALNTFKVPEKTTLKNAFKSKLFSLKGNIIYFRGTIICIVENTLFHLISNAGILLDKAPKISFNFFNKIIEKSSPPEKKLLLLKNLLQAMGWGIITITMEGEKKITVEIKNPPYGLQLEKDNWDFLYRVIQGYVWLINKEFKIKRVKEEFKKLTVTYAA